MAIYKPSELNEFLKSLGVRPKKGLSQNFLIDGNIIRKIVKAAAVEKGDVVLEIGPGPGSLTQALLETGAEVIAVEMDRVLAGALERLQTEDSRLRVYCSDIMAFPLEEELGKRVGSGKKIKIVANLPYHITTPILAQCAPLYSLFESITIMVQEEVGRRMTAKAGGADWSSLSLFLDFYSEARFCFTVSKNCFMPVPGVDSAIVQLVLHPAPLDKSESLSFFQLTQTAFQHRRKMLRSSLRELYPPTCVAAALLAIGQREEARPEALSLDDFLRLHQILVRDNSV